MSNIQTRGHCQCCGNLQAVRGTVSKHGYTVKNGWFQGVCSGQHFAAIETSREQTDKIIAQIAIDVEHLRDDVAMLRDGTFKPQFVVKYKWVAGKQQEIKIPFAEAESWDQVDEVQKNIHRIESRIRAGESFAKYLGEVADKYHGQPLVEVKKVEAAARICSGEKRVNEVGKVLTASYQDGARVYYSFVNSKGSVFKHWMGSRAWRNLSLA